MWKSLYENRTFCLQLLAETSNFGKHEDLGVHLSFYSVPKIVDIYLRIISVSANNTEEQIQVCMVQSFLRMLLVECEKLKLE